MTTYPTLNLNGTDGASLLEEYAFAHAAVEAAIAAHDKITLHGRDYQTMPAGSFEAAREAHHARFMQLVGVRNELLVIAIHLQGQMRERIRAKGTP